MYLEISKVSREHALTSSSFGDDVCLVTFVSFQYSWWHPPQKGSCGYQQGCKRSTHVKPSGLVTRFIQRPVSNPEMYPMLIMKTVFPAHPWSVAFHCPQKVAIESEAVATQGLGVSASFSVCCTADQTFLLNLYNYSPSLT